MNILKKALTFATVGLLVLAGSAVGGAAYQAGTFRVVGDVNVYDNDPLSDYNTAIEETPRIQLDGSAGDIILEGATQDAFETIIADTDVAQDVTISYPDATSGAFTLGDTTASWVQGATPADALDTKFFVADRAYTITDVDVSWGTAESTGAMDVMVEKLNGVTACGSGTDVLAAVVDATATADTTTSPALHATAANSVVAAGDALCVDVSATPNEIANLVVTVALRVD